MRKPKYYYGHAYDLLKTDDRLEKYKQQRKERGFDDTELWSLDSTIIDFVAPRLERLLEIRQNVFDLSEPHSQETLKELQFVSQVFNDIVNEKIDYYSLKDNKIVEKALKLFAKNFMTMWY